MTREDATPARNIVLTGFMGTGKTSAGKIVSDHLGWDFVDTDSLVEAMAGRGVPEIIREDGETAFRELERIACQEVAQRDQQVIATGGGAMLDGGNRAALSNGNLVVCLTADPAEIVHRLDGDETRPLLDGNPVGRIHELMEERALVYDALPHKIDTTHRTPEQVAEEVLTLWRQG